MQTKECLNCGELYDVSRARTVDKVPAPLYTTYCSIECMEASQEEMREGEAALKATGFVVRDEPTPEQAAGKSLNEILSKFKADQRAKSGNLDPEDVA